MNRKRPPTPSQPPNRGSAIILWIGIAFFLVMVGAGISAIVTKQNTVFSVISFGLAALTIPIGILQVAPNLLPQALRTLKTGLLMIVILLLVGSLAMNVYLLTRLWTPSIPDTNPTHLSVATPASCSPPGNATIPDAGHLTQMEDDASQWGFFSSTGDTADLRCVTNPSIDGTALKIAPLDGQNGHPSTDLRAYRDLPAANKATVFELSLSFYFTSTNHMQSFLFTMSKWINAQRLDWELQWEIIPDGTSEAGNPPTWRVWDGGANTWRDTHIMQQLSPNTWHKLDLKGNISNGQVHYISFSCDTTLQLLGQMFRPVSDDREDHLAITAQLHADDQGAPYQDQLYIDGVNFRFEPV